MAVAYFKASGALVSLAHGTNTPSPLTDELAYVAIVDEDVSPENFYYDVDAQRVLPKQMFNVRVFGGKIDNIPPGTKVRTESGIYVIDDGVLEIDSNFSGAEIEVLLTNVKYHSKVARVMV
jgi:hypothetical protein